MIRLVLDASVILKWILPETSKELHGEQALEVLRRIKTADVSVLEPPHWLAEVAAVLTRLAPDIAHRAIDLLWAMEFPVAEELEIYSQASILAARLGQHVFDTLYHSVALYQPETFLLTADTRYYRRASPIGSIMRLQAIIRIVNTQT